MPNVMLDDYGAKGDGKFDNAPALERAKKAAKGGEIHLTAGGKYRLSRHVPFQDGEGQIIGAMGASIWVDADA
ncbi:hypothetical protein RQ831_18260 [Roseomonas gilardii]|uniref:Pectate lyase superfamily protein domain-containing protein n=1 Tax=Roseomonas gilardii TaxID=257708 RepID=A0ABU3MJU9_9PROT|nr:hypothetical protein [Roseomonas gilardii]MDT8333000.1 hypothetical protein [Roseomonas gilardii]